MAPQNTTIKISQETKIRLTKLKEFQKETYDEVIRKMLYIFNILKKEPETAQKALNKIDNAIKRHEKYTQVYPSSNSTDRGNNKRK